MALLPMKRLEFRLVIAIAGRIITKSVLLKASSRGGTRMSCESTMQHDYIGAKTLLI